MILNADNYYSREANQEYFSASQIKAFLDCPARAMAEINGEWERKPTDALLIGAYVDAAFESDAAFGQFCVDHNAEINTTRAPIKKRSEFVKADAMIERAKSDAVFMEYMRGDKQVILTGHIFGAPFKAKIDVLRRRCIRKAGQRIVDLKTVKDLEPVYVAGQGKLNFADAWNWPLQMAIYQRIEGHNLPCYLAVITKEEPANIEIVEIPQARLDAEIELLEDKMDYFRAVKAGFAEPARCEKCAYCRATKKLTKPLTLDYFDFETTGGNIA